MKYTIGELAEIIDGDRGSNYPKQDEFFDTGFCLFLNTGNVTKAGFSFESVQFITEEKDRLLRKGRLQRGDIVYTTRGTVGNAAFYSSSVPYEHVRINSGMVILRCRDEIVDTRFLYQVLKSEYFRPYFKKYCTGSAQPQLPIKNLSTIALEMPDKGSQIHIANILTAYDNLIENNQKQIKLLEEAAQRLYKEWFIDLRFPGYETTPVHDGVPEGWERKTIGELISYEIGGGWGEETQSNNADNGAFVIRGTDLYGLTHGNLTEIPFRYHGKNNLAARALQDGDIVFEVSGGSRTEGVARTALVRENLLARYSNPVMCASFCKLIRPLTQEYSQYLYDHFQYLRSSGKTEEYDKRSASSIVNYRWKDFLSQETILKPSRPIIELYNQNAATIYNAIIAKSLQIETARNARDRLLPKLMSGESEV